MFREALRYLRTALSRSETDTGTEAMTAQSSARAGAAATEPALLRENVGNIAVLTLNRPQARNSLSEAMLAALSQELEDIAADKRVRAVVMAAGGPLSPPDMILRS